MLPKKEKFFMDHLPEWLRTHRGPKLKNSGSQANRTLCRTLVAEKAHIQGIDWHRNHCRIEDALPPCQVGMVFRVPVNLQSLLQLQQQAPARFEQSKGGDKGDKGGKRDLMRQASGVGILTPKTNGEITWQREWKLGNSSGL